MALYGPAENAGRLHEDCREFRPYRRGKRLCRAGRATALASAGRDIINLGIGQPDFRTPEHIVEAAAKALRDGHHGYTPAVGILPLREAVSADLHKRYGANVSPDEVMIMPGGKPTMFMSILMFGEPGVEIMYPDPGFPIYRSMIEYTGATPVPIPIREENGFAFSAEETLGLISDRTRLIIINSPANPTGGVTPKAEVEKFVAGMEKWPQVAVMSDEIYDQLIYDGEQHITLLNYPSIRNRLILLNGWSKTYAMTGWRLGYAIWPGKLYDYARKLAVNLHSCVNAPTQYAGIAALTGPQDAVAHMREQFDKPPQAGGGRTQQASRHQLHHAQRRVLRFPEHQADRLEGQAAGQCPAGRNRRGADRRPGLRHSWRGVFAPVLCQFGGKHPARAGAGGRLPQDPQGGVKERRREPERQLQFQAVIFDCDGVLVDSEKLALEVELEVLAGLGLTFERDDYVLRFMGLSTDAFHAAIDEEAQKRLGRSIVTEVRGSERLRQVMIEHLTEVPGALEAISRCGSPRQLPAPVRAPAWSAS